MDCAFHNPVHRFHEEILRNNPALADTTTDLKPVGGDAVSMQVSVYYIASIRFRIFDHNGITLGATITIDDLASLKPTSA